VQPAAYARYLCWLKALVKHPELVWLGSALLAEMTKHIRVRAAGGSGAVDDAAELASFTPSFLWLLRDFYLRLEEDGRQVGSCLLPQAVAS
jgi:hypothetical protein